MRKIKHSSKNITPFGGLNFIYNALNRSKIEIFNQNGDLESLKRYSSLGELEETYIYTYDKNNNWTEKLLAIIKIGKINELNNVL